ncbi:PLASMODESMATA CALLOSE-BINDING PROTEIN 3-like [Hibiscus syriacus]|uniref:PLASMODESMATA CALLOSE-BINDING PROTEIN 3-like n=1 Tax=Hibiscus syriacus TaxID=106335 RepID=UPI001924FFAC|nr:PLASMODESMATA CALLOSE-BINDING PROTEIN 3-like [Hibiscus syriacus]
MTGRSNVTYCLCKDGVDDQMLQKTLDYACEAEADCSVILQKSGCFNPDTVKDHCIYVVNSYFQRTETSPVSTETSPYRSAVSYHRGTSPYVPRPSPYVTVPRTFQVLETPFLCRPRAS